MTKPLKQRFEEKYIPVPESGCWLWIGATNSRFGYGVLNAGNPKQVRTHRVSYELHKGPIPPGMCVCHKCDTPSCVNPDHLFLGTTSDNTKDMIQKGRKAPPMKGENSPVSKLTNKEVNEIRDLKGYMYGKDVAKAYGVHKETVFKYWAGKRRITNY